MFQNRSTESNAPVASLAASVELVLDRLMPSQVGEVFSSTLSISPGVQSPPWNCPWLVAGVHRATVYRHFASREELIARLYGGYLEDVGAIVTGIDPDAPDILTELRRMTTEVYEANVIWKAFAWAPAFPRQFAAPRDRMIGGVERAFTRARDEGVLRADMSVMELHTAWGAPIQYLSSRIVDGGWTVEAAVAFTLRLVVPPDAERPTAR